MSNSRLLFLCSSKKYGQNWTALFDNGFTSFFFLSFPFSILISLSLFLFSSFIHLLFFYLPVSFYFSFFTGNGSLFEHTPSYFQAVSENRYGYNSSYQNGEDELFLSASSCSAVSLFFSFDSASFSACFVLLSGHGAEIRNPSTYNAAVASDRSGYQWQQLSWWKWNWSQQEVTSAVNVCVSRPTLTPVSKFPLRL